MATETTFRLCFQMQFCVEAQIVRKQHAVEICRVGEVIDCVVRLMVLVVPYVLLPIFY